MKKMMKNLGKYVRKKKLEVNVEKTKMTRKKKREENEWNWEGRNIEHVNKFKWLSHTFSERATDKARIREIVRKASKIVGCVWRIRERK
jgi:DNA-directed RNA polymerase subunit F